MWNHILAARHPATGRVCYFLTLQPGATRHFIGELDFTCCNGSGMEIPLRTLDYLFYHSDDALWVNQFIPAEAQWSQRGVTIRQETAFPDESQTKLTLRCAAPTTFALHVRRPPWAGDGFAIAVNGEQVDVDAEPGSFASLAREWADGDVVLVSLPDPLPLRTEPMPDNDRRVAILAGPIVLAGDLSDAEDDDRVPALVTDGRPVEQWVVPTGERPLRYRTQGVGRPRDVALLPFYAAYDGPATVYWDLFDADQWAAHEAQYRAAQQRRAALDARTVDVLALGEMQPERDHGVAGEKTAAGEFQRRKFRHAWDGGWFSCELAVPAAGPAELIVDYWGGETGAREFDVQVDGQRIATTSLQMDAPGQFWQQTYPLPVELIAGKERVTVRFQAQPGNYAGGVFGIRVAAPESEPRP